MVFANSAATFKTSVSASCGKVWSKLSSMSLRVMPLDRHSRINGTERRVPRMARPPPSKRGSATIHLYSLKGRRSLVSIERPPTESIADITGMPNFTAGREEQVEKADDGLSVWTKFSQ